MTDLKAKGLVKKLLLAFLLIFSLLFMLFVWNFYQSHLPECWWKAKQEPFQSTERFIGSNRSAKELLQDYELIQGRNYTVQTPFYNFWKFKLKEDGEVVDVYGVDQGGDIYGYKKVCEKEKEKGILDQIKFFFGSLLSREKGLERMRNVSNRSS